jgi:NitT/TauT family transport system permease protein
MRRTIVAGLFFATLILIWHAAAASGRWSPVLLPTPWSVAEYLWGALRDGTLVEATAVTLKRLLVGYVIGVVIGLVAGLLTSRFDFLEDTIGTLALGLQTLPSWLDSTRLAVVRTN